MNRLITILFLGMTAIFMQVKTDNEQLTNEARAEGKLACTMPCKEKEDESQIEALYRVMYKAMMAKDTVTLNRIHADDFVLTHMTGMYQSKQEYISAIAGCTLNYYSVLVNRQPSDQYSRVSAHMLVRHMLHVVAPATRKVINTYAVV